MRSESLSGKLIEVTETEKLMTTMRLVSSEKLSACQASGSLGHGRLGREFLVDWYCG